MKTYSIGLSMAMTWRALDELISSTSAANVVDLPLPVGPEITINPVVISVSRFRSGCRLQARKIVLKRTQEPHRHRHAAQGLENIDAAANAGNRAGNVRGPATQEIAASRRCPAAPVRLARASRPPMGWTDRGELAADARDRRGIRFDMQIASAKLAALSNPLLNGHV